MSKSVRPSDFEDVRHGKGWWLGLPFLPAPTFNSLHNGAGKKRQWIYFFVVSISIIWYRMTTKHASMPWWWLPSFICVQFCVHTWQIITNLCTVSSVADCFFLFRLPSETTQGNNNVTLHIHTDTHSLSHSGHDNSFDSFCCGNVSGAGWGCARPLHLRRCSSATSEEWWSDHNLSTDSWALTVRKQAVLGEGEIGRDSQRHWGNRHRLLTKVPVRCNNVFNVR